MFLLVPSAIGATGQQPASQRGLAGLLATQQELDALPAVRLSCRVVGITSVSYLLCREGARLPPDERVAAALWHPALESPAGTPSTLLRVADLGGLPGPTLP